LTGFGGKKVYGLNLNIKICLAYQLKDLFKPKMDSPFGITLTLNTDLGINLVLLLLTVPCFGERTAGVAVGGDAGTKAGYRGFAASGTGVALLWRNQACQYAQ
jgi:hypothetical protein